LAEALADRELGDVADGGDLVEVAKEDLAHRILTEFGSNFEVVSVEFLD